MSNPNYNKQTSQGYASKGAGGYKYHKGVKGREAGPAMKDDPKGWPDPTPHWGTSLNRAAKFPVVKTHVVKKGVD